MAVVASPAGGARVVAAAGEIRCAAVAGRRSAGRGHHQLGDAPAVAPKQSPARNQRQPAGHDGGGHEHAGPGGAIEHRAVERALLEPSVKRGRFVEVRLCGRAGRGCGVAQDGQLP